MIARMPLKKMRQMKNGLQLHSIAARRTRSIETQATNVTMAFWGIRSSSNINATIDDMANITSSSQKYGSTRSLQHS